MTQLSQPVRVVADAGETHGVIDDVEKFCNGAINRYLGPRAGYLVGEKRSEMLSWLFIAVVRCAREYDPAEGKRFVPYVHQTLMWRLTDKYRKDGGDRRYKPRPQLESIEDRLEEIRDLEEFVERDVITEIDTTGMTPASRMALKKIVRALQLGIPKDEIAEYYGWTRRELNRHLHNLREELPRKDLLAA
jgi:hypothetical protein